MKTDLEEKNEKRYKERNKKNACGKKGTRKELENERWKEKVSKIYSERKNEKRKKETSFNMYLGVGKQTYI